MVYLIVIYKSAFLLELYWVRNHRVGSCGYGKESTCTRRWQVWSLGHEILEEELRQPTPAFLGRKSWQRVPGHFYSPYEVRREQHDLGTKTTAENRTQFIIIQIYWWYSDFYFYIITLPSYQFKMYLITSSTHII